MYATSQYTRRGEEGGCTFNGISGKNIQIEKKGWNSGRQIVASRQILWSFGEIVERENAKGKVTLLTTQDNCP